MILFSNGRDTGTGQSGANDLSLRQAEDVPFSVSRIKDAVSFEKNMMNQNDEKKFGVIRKSSSSFSSQTISFIPNTGSGGIAIDRNASDDEKQRICQVILQKTALACKNAFIVSMMNVRNDDIHICFSSISPFIKKSVNQKNADSEDGFWHVLDRLFLVFTSQNMRVFFSADYGSLMDKGAQITVADNIPYSMSYMNERLYRAMGYRMNVRLTSADERTVYMQASDITRNGLAVNEADGCRCLDWLYFQIAPINPEVVITYSGNIRNFRDGRTNYLKARVRHIASAFCAYDIPIERVACRPGKVKIVFNENTVFSLKGQGAEFNQMIIHTLNAIYKALCPFCSAVHFASQNGNIILPDRTVIAEPQTPYKPIK